MCDANTFLAAFDVHEESTSGDASSDLNSVFGDFSLGRPKKHRTIVGGAELFCALSEV